MFGVINLFKPAGPTSRDCVNRLQRWVRPAKLGHAGTLDPLAEGVLLMAVGQAVRLVDWFHQLPKSYVARFEWGRTSPSADLGSEVENLREPPIPDREEILAILPRFLGSIQQVPPLYSAVWVDGKRAHRLARAGKPIELAPRPVTVYRLEVLEYDYPTMTLSLECGTGTYVRSIGRDIARSLGSDAVMTHLHRTSIGPLTSHDAVRLDRLQSRDEFVANLISPVRCLSHLPSVRLQDAQRWRLFQGKSIDLPELATAEEGEHVAEVLAVDEAGELCAILRRSSPESWKPHRNFIERT